MSKNHEDYVTHVKNEEDLVYLRGTAFPVNMRLFHTSTDYKAIVLQCCAYIRDMCLNGADGYKKPHGMSGANLAIPFNIIGVTRNREQKDEYVEIMINPVIQSYSTSKIITLSNCGSLTLPEQIPVERAEFIVVEYYDESGEIHYNPRNRNQAGFSIQHEVDHNNGILIIDREVKDESI